MPLKGYKKTEECKKKISETMKGRVFSKEHKKNVSIACKGLKSTLEHRKKLSETHSGEKNYNWKGGITSENYRIRKSFEYKIWRENVFKRDFFACVFGGKEHGGKIQADHIKPFALYPELRFELSNGRTLCVDCHMKTPTWGRQKIIHNQDK